MPPAFQSTLPVGGATSVTALAVNALKISIHAPRGGSDLPGGGQVKRLPDFNPRSPWGERLRQDMDTIVGMEFQSTLPVGGATIAD